MTDTTNPTNDNSVEIGKTEHTQVSADNSFASPENSLTPDAEAQSVSEFYRMSTRKLFLMSVLTMGLYNVCFWWRHWKTRKEAGDDVTPWLRTLFSVFTVFSYHGTLTTEAKVQEKDLGSIFPAMAFLYLGFSMGSHLLSKMESGGAFLAMIMVNILLAWSLVKFQVAANGLTEDTAKTAPFNSGVTWGSAVMGSMGGLLLIAGCAEVLLGA